MLPLRYRRAVPADPDLVRRAACGDARAWDALVAAHGAAVWGLCRRLDPEPEDAWQEAWAKLLSVARRFDPDGPATFRTWLLRVVHRQLVDRHRARLRSRDVLAEIDVADAAAGPEAVAAARSDAEALDAALAALPAIQRRVVVLHHLHGEPLDAIAATEGVAVGTIKSRLHRGRGRLARLLGDRR